MNLLKPLSERSLYRNVTPNFLDINDSSKQKEVSNDKLLRQYIETDDALEQLRIELKKNRVQNEANTISSQILKKEIENSYKGNLKNDLLISLQNTQIESLENLNENIAAQNAIQIVSDYLTPSNMNRLRDSLINCEQEKFQLEHPYRWIRQADAKIISKSVRLTLNLIIQKKISEVSKFNLIVKNIINNQRSIAFEINIVTANLSIKNITWQINSLLYFDRGSAILNEKGKKSIEQDINIYFDSLFATVQKKFQSDSGQHKVILTFYVDGYSDSQGFRGIYSQAINMEKNRSLSQKRSDNIMAILLNIYKKKAQTTKIVNLIFMPPQKYSTGHGEDVPDHNKLYKENGLDDVERRVVTLKSIINAK